MSSLNGCCTKKSGLEFTAFPGKVEIVAERQKLEGGFQSSGKIPVLTSNVSFLVGRVEIGVERLKFL